MTMGMKIKALRSAQHLSQSDLAAGFFSRSYISQIERDLVKPSKKAIQHLANVFNVSLLELVDENDFVDKKINEKLHINIESGLEAFVNKDYDKVILYLDRVLGFEQHMSPAHVIDFYACLIESNYELLNYTRVQYLFDELMSNLHDISRGEHARIVFLKFLQAKTYEHEFRIEVYFGLISEITLEFEKHNLDVPYDIKMKIYYEQLLVADDMDIEDDVMKVLNKMQSLYRGSGIVTDEYILSRLKHVAYSAHDTSKVAIYKQCQNVIDLCGLLEKYSLLYKGLCVMIELLFEDKKYEEVRCYIDDMYGLMTNDVLELSPVDQAYYYLYEGKYYTKTKAFDTGKEFFNKSRSFDLRGEDRQVCKFKIDSMVGYVELYLELGQVESAQLYLEMAIALAEDRDRKKPLL